MTPTWQWLKLKMRKTLLGQKTLHGVSMLAAEVMANVNLNRENASGTDKKLEKSMDMIEEHLDAVRDQLSITNLNFVLLRRRLRPLHARHVGGDIELQAVVRCSEAIVPRSPRRD